MEIERNSRIIDIKNVEVAVIAASQDGRALTADDLVDGKTNPSLTEKVGTAHEKEVKESLQFNNNNDESSSESDVDKGNVKVETAESKPSISQDINKSESNSLIESIGK